MGVALEPLMEQPASTNDYVLLGSLSEALHERDGLKLAAAQLLAEIDMTQTQTWAALAACYSTVWRAITKLSSTRLLVQMKLAPSNKSVYRK